MSKLQVYINKVFLYAITVLVFSIVPLVNAADLDPLLPSNLVVFEALGGDQGSPRSWPSELVFSHEQYLVTWSGEDAVNCSSGGWPCSDIFGRIVSPAGTFVTEAFEVSANRGTSQLWPSSASNGATYLVVWVDATDDRVMGQIVTRTGDLLGREIEITPEGSSVLSNGVDVASDGTNYLVTWASQPDMFQISTQRVTGSGQLDGSPILVSSSVNPEFNPSIIFGNGKYFLSWEHNADLDGALLDNLTGSVQNFPIANGVGCQGSIENCDIIGTRPGGVSFDGTNYIAVWRDDNRNGDVFANRVTSSGVLLDGAANGGGINLSVGTGGEWPQITYGNGEWLAIWQSSFYTTTARRIALNGTLIDVAPITMFGEAFYPPLASDGTNYMIAWDTGEQEMVQLFGPGLPRASANVPFITSTNEIIELDASNSFSPVTNALTYNWDFGDNISLMTTSPVITHNFSTSGNYLVSLSVDDGSQVSSTYESVTIVSDSSGGGQNSEVDDFLSFINIDSSRVRLPAGTTSFDLKIAYGQTIFADTFQAVLEGQSVGSFNPHAGSDEIVNIPLVSGRNVLKLSVEGIKAPAHIAKDQDQLVFLVD